jgi:hypothetical protein
MFEGLMTVMLLNTISTKLISKLWTLTTFLIVVFESYRTLWNRLSQRMRVLISGHSDVIGH